MRLCQKWITNKENLNLMDNIFFETVKNLQCYRIMLCFGLTADEGFSVAMASHSNIRHCGKGCWGVLTPILAADTVFCWTVWEPQVWSLTVIVVYNVTEAIKSHYINVVVQRVQYFPVKCSGAELYSPVKCSTKIMTHTFIKLYFIHYNIWANVLCCFQPQRQEHIISFSCFQWLFSSSFALVYISFYNGHHLPVVFTQVYSSWNPCRS